MSRAEPVAFVVVDLGFGDSGKGVVTDFLVRARAARTVVRFNGGAQAGHNVVTPDGRHHTFSQLGSGSFVSGVHTYLSRFFVLHPTALGVEADVLARKGVPDALARVAIEEDALVTTPFHQSLNRVRELARGERRHGSCGVGFGEAVRAARDAPEDAIRVSDFARPSRLRKKLRHVQEAASSQARCAATEIMTHDDERRVLESTSIGDDWLERALAILRRVQIVGGEALAARFDEPVVFEGAQGVLLDERFGFFPHCTFSNCTPHNALTLLAECGHAHRTHRVGVLRTYLTRHGQGPFPTEDLILRKRLDEPHNSDDAWQGAFRVGWPDLVLSRYATDVCESLDTLAVTHCDALERLDVWKYAIGYDKGTALYAVAPSERIEVTRALARAKPVYETCDAETVPTRIANALGLPIELSAFGPTACDVHAAMHRRML